VGRGSKVKRVSGKNNIQFIFAIVLSQKSLKEKNQCFGVVYSTAGVRAGAKQLL
jgi:hypothetical protein